MIQNDGVLGESNVIRIGTQGTGSTQQNICYVAGITGATPVSVNTPQVVLCDNTGNLAPIDSSTSGFVLTSNGTATPSFQSASASGAITTITGNSGGAESPSSGNFDIVGTGSITVAGSANTETVQLTGLTNHALLVGAGTPTITKVGPTATSGQVLQSQGSSSDPAFSTATYPSTTTTNEILYSSATNTVGQISASNNGVLITSNTGVPSLLANSGTPGFILTANAGAPPSWQAPSTPYTNVASSPYTVLATDAYISVDCSGIPITLNFPNAPTSKQTWVVKDRTGSANVNHITINTPGGTVTFDGSNTYTLDDMYESIQIIANPGGNYEIY